MGAWSLARHLFSGAAIFTCTAVQAQQAEIRAGTQDSGNVLGELLRGDLVVRVERFRDPAVSVDLNYLANDRLNIRFALQDPSVPDPRYPGYFLAGESSYIGYRSDANINGVLLSSEVGYGRVDLIRTTATDYSVRRSDFHLSVFLPCKSGAVIADQGRSLEATSSIMRSDPSDLLNGFHADPYGVRIDGNSPQQVYTAYRAFLDGTPATIAPTFLGSQQFTGSQFREAVYGCSVSDAGTNPLVGNSRSLQFQMAAAGMDLARTPSNISIDDRQWGVGFSFARISEGGRDGVQFDANISKSWRLSEGSRARIIVAAPVSVERFGSATRLRGFVSLGVHLPILNMWSLEPRVAFGGVRARQNSIWGTMATASIASRWSMNGIGRGVLIVGNMVGYTKVTKIEFEGKALDARTDNMIVRNAIAYEFPLDGRLINRSSSARAGYTYSRFSGHKLYARNIHEVALSLGIRSREDTIRNRVETIRIGGAGSAARGYTAWHMFVGYRF